jgi:acetyltransferase-like isoleucine patch superfamily enzyme
MRFLENRRAPTLVRGRNVNISPHARVVGSPNTRIEIGDDTRVEHGALINPYVGWIRIGKRCSFGPYSVVYGHGGLTIGDDVLIAAHVVIVPSQHNFADPTRTIREQGTTETGIEIESDVWIGAHAVILPGVTIGTR